MLVVVLLFTGGYSDSNDIMHYLNCFTIPCRYSCVWYYCI